MGAWKKSVLSAGKAQPTKPRGILCFRGGGYLGFFGGRGECRFYFYGCEDFSDDVPPDIILFYHIKISRRPHLVGKLFAWRNQKAEGEKEN